MDFCKYVVGFRRQRATEAGKSPYVVVFDSFNLRPKGATFQLHNTVSDVVFQAQLFPLQDNTVRLKINEESPLVLRYESPVGDVLVGEPQTQRLVIFICNFSFNFEQCFDTVGWAVGRAFSHKKREWCGAGMVICLE